MLARAALVPKQCGLIPLAAGVRLKDYADLIDFDIEAMLHAPYIECCKAITIFAMRALPPGERLEVVFERQDEYVWLAEMESKEIASTMTHPQLLIEDGKTSKLANWRYIAKNQTVLCEPADYLAYALLQQSRDKNSVKSHWTYPIIAADPTGGVAAVLGRKEVGQMILLDKVELTKAVFEQIKQIFLDEDAKRKNSEEAPNSPEFDRFADTVRSIVNVSKLEMQTSMDEHRKTGKRLSKGFASLSPVVAAKLRSASSKT